MYIESGFEYVSQSCSDMTKDDPLNREGSLVYRL